jgi:hypothetical protein
MFDEACFPFVASPHLTNDYEFLSEMDTMPSPIATRLSAGTTTTTVGGMIAPSGGLITHVAEADGPPAHPSSGSVAPPGGMTVPPDSVTARVAEAGGQTAPPGGLTACFVEANGLPTRLMDQSTSLVPCVATMTPTLPSAPRMASTTPTLTSMPRVAPTTPPAASSVVPISPQVPQPVPRLLSAGAVPIFLMVHSHLMRT